MAKLSAHGYEVCRWVNVFTRQTDEDKWLPKGSQVRTTTAYMSDGTILQKCCFRDSADEKWRVGTWKVHSRLKHKASMSTAERVATIARVAGKVIEFKKLQMAMIPKRATANEFSWTGNYVKPDEEWFISRTEKVLEMKAELERPRIVVHAGDIEFGAGVCLACGEIASSGCDPDQVDGECESCGQRKLMGMELAIMSQKVDLAPGAEKALANLM